MREELDLCPTCRHCLITFLTKERWYAYCGKLDRAIRIRDKCPWYEDELEDYVDIYDELDEEIGGEVDDIADEEW